MKFTATTNGDKLIFENQDLLQGFLLRLKDKKLSVKIEKYKKPRSLNQNALYWEWLGIIADELGYTADEMHTTFKARLLVDRSGKIPVVRSTTTLSTTEMATYMSHVERIASELNIILPRPDDTNSNP